MFYSNTPTILTAYLRHTLRPPPPGYIYINTLSEQVFLLESLFELTQSLNVSSTLQTFSYILNVILVLY